MSPRQYAALYWVAAVAAAGFLGACVLNGFQGSYVFGLAGTVLVAILAAAGYVHVD